MRTRYPATTANPNIPDDTLVLVEWEEGVYTHTVFFDGDMFYHATQGHGYPFYPDEIWEEAAAFEAGLSDDALNAALAKWENGETLEPVTFEPPAPVWTDAPSHRPTIGDMFSIPKPGTAAAMTLDRCLDKVYQWEDGDYSMRAFLLAHPPVSKHAWEYKGRTRYSLDMGSKQGDGVIVPATLYRLSTAPEKEA